MNYLFLGLSVVLGIVLWMLPHSPKVSDDAWALFSIFMTTIFGIIFKPLPMGAMAMMGFGALLLTNTLTFEEAAQGFSSEIVWLVIIAFFIARGFIKTGLGTRMSYFFMLLFGKNTLGLAYSLVATELVLAPAIPSVTARSGAIVFPIALSLAKIFGSEPNSSTAKDAGAFFISVVFQTSCITSAMFLTAMGGNPLIMQIAQNAGVFLSWGGWIFAALIPGICSLLIIPYLIYFFMPPKIKAIPGAQSFARQHLLEMGPMKRSEKIMMATFLLLIFLWIFGSFVGVRPTTAAILGLMILVVTDVLSWKEINQEAVAWETFIWLSILSSMTVALNESGFMTWFSQWAVSQVMASHWLISFGFLTLLYFYAHYLFASNIAHIGAMYSPFLLISIAIGVPPVFAALVLAFCSSLFGGLTHYGSGPAAVMFGSGYLSLKEWWKIGLICSIANLIIWLGLGSLWWKFIGLW